MSKDDYSEPRGKVTLKTLIPPGLVAVLSVLIVGYLRLSPDWDSSLSLSPIVMVLLVFLLVIFYAAILISVADFREMKGTISGWFDVLGLMVAEGVLSYLVFAHLLYVAIVVVLCCVFVAYVSFVQGD